MESIQGLLNCPDCGHRVSAQAISCPSCGRGIKETTIELTGKKWKAMQLVGSIMFLGGMLFLFINLANDKSPGTPFFVFFIGLILTVWAKVAIWWHHK